MSLPGVFFLSLILQSQRGQESFLSRVAFSFSFLFINAPQKFNISTFNFLYQIWKNDKSSSPRFEHLIHVIHDSVKHFAESCCSLQSRYASAFARSAMIM